MPAPRQSGSQISRCTFCGSSSYGKGCRHAPHGVHVHVGNSTKCSYCGSPAYGRGCRLNPDCDLHVHGIVYNNMIKEEIREFLDNNVLLNELKKEFTQFQCFKLGIIDENGNKIKSPITEQEHASYTPYTRTLLQLKKYLGFKLNLIEASTSLKQQSVKINEGLEKYKKTLEYRDKIDTVLNDLYAVLEEAAQDGLTSEDVKKLIRA